MFKIGEKVMIDNEERLIGEIIELITYDEFDFDIDYKIRVYGSHYKNGFFDFTRDENSLKLI